MSQVKLISLSQPYIDGCNTAEDLIAYCARVSNPTNQANTNTSSKLLKYLIEHKHWSPFEMVSMTLEIKTTRDIARQILRHRSFSYQEFSQRYAEVLEPMELKEVRLQDSKNRQNSLEVDNEELSEWWEWEQNNLADHAELVYQQALERGIAKEIARSVLPEGLTPSTLYMTGSIRSWIHYIQIRTYISTQKEHREVALLCKNLLIDNFPSLTGLI